MYHVSAQGVDERMINVPYYYGQTGMWDFQPWILSQWEHNAVTTEISQSD